MKAIKLLHCMLMILLLFAVGSVSAANKNPFIDRFAPGSRVVVAVEDDYFPFSYTDRDGRRIGFDVDFSRMLCHELKLNCRLESMPFARILQAVEEGSVDLGICGASQTADRAKRLLFSRPYYRSSTIFVGRAGAEHLDFAYQTAHGLKLGAQTATVQGQILKQYFGHNNKIILCENYQQLFEAAVSGELDAILVDGLAGYQYMKMESFMDLVLIGTLPDIDLQSEYSRIVLNLRDRVGLKLVDDAILQILLSRDYQMLSLRYFPFIAY